MSAITAKASRKMKKYAVLTREPRCFLGSFDFSWEQRKFEEIAVRSSVICSDDTLPRVEYEDIVSGTGRLNKDIYAKQSSKSGIAFHQGDVLYGKLRPYLQNWLLPTFDGLAVGDFWVLQPQNADSSFLYRLIQSRQFDEVANQSTGTKMPRADWKLVSKTVFSIPSNISEQAAIGTYFTALDSLITLHQRKCVFLFGFFQAFISMIFTASTFSWEQRKLGDMMNVTSVKRIHQSDWTDSGVRFLRARDIVAAAKNEEPDDYLYISKEKYEEYSALSGKVGVSDLLVTGVGTIGVPYLVRNLEPLYFKDGNIIWFQNSDKIDGKFLFYSFSAEQIQGFINESAGIGTVGTYTIESGKRTPISIPNQIEQAKVGEFFQQLDNLITLHQRECISFTARAGRFILTANKKRNTSSWEQRKFSELVQIERGGSPRPIDDFITDAPNGLNWVKIGDAPTQGNYITKTAEKIRPEGLSKTREVHPGDLILSNSMSFGKPYIMGIDGCIHDGWLLIRNTFGVFDLTFLCHLLGTPQMLSQYRSLAAGSTVNNLNKELVGNTYVTIPSITEQRALGAYLEQLDNLITLHQRKPFLMKWRTSDANRNQTNRLVL